jgi:hypothetical protein
MGKTPRQHPPRARHPFRAPLRAGELILDWATLALLGVATVALAASTRLPTRRRRNRTKPVSEHPDI